MLRLKLVLCVLTVLLLPAAYAEYASIGITQNQVQNMLMQESLNPTFNKFPPLDGESVISATIWNSYIDIEMIGTDEGLTSVTLSPTSAT